MNSTPRLRMFAGANGSGKSTLKSVINPAPKSIDNLLNHYAPLCDLTLSMDNSILTPETIFIYENSVLTVINSSKYEQIRNL